MTAERCWILTEGHAGMESQGMGVANALGCETVLKRSRLRFPWRFAPPNILLPPLSAVTRDSDSLMPPWPNLLITCGKRSVGISIALRRRSAGRIFTVHIQDPHVHPRNFDLVAAPRHDGLTGANVIVTNMAVHPVTRERLETAKRAFMPMLRDLPRPLVAVLIGGSNRRYRLTNRVMASIAEQLASLCAQYGAGLVITPSRRTGERNEAVLRERLMDCPAVIWDGRGENPYFGFLALADAIIVTGDSVSMVSEACATGKPVYVIDLEGGSKRFNRFHDLSRRDGLTRPFVGTLETWHYTPPDDTTRVAEEVRRRLDSRHRDERLH